MRSLLLLPLLAACAATPPPCPPGSTAATRLEGYFGRNAQGAEVVDDAAWTRFMDEVVTPAFPDGLTVLDGAGQWRGTSGRLARERSKVLVVLAPGATPAEAAARLAPVIAAFRGRFAQESVMVTTAEACVRF
ncbi:DUF3574 domain-containing protein [Falsiroseomonas sp.]|uniref:DUF3574 domain-containing protein n=1 Tax=Falsiroseomonas sp. TaxID=2870721 RepID=UPI003F6F18CA